MVRVGGSLVAWRSRLQGCLSQSSSEAELVAVTALANEVQWWRRLWADLGYSVRGPGPVPLWVDNRSTTLLADHAGSFDSTKHMELRHLVVRDYVASGAVDVRWVRSEFQLADVLTKNVGVKVFRRLVSEVMGEDV